MNERLNIWGKTGCELPNGNLCDACCIVPEIQDPNWGDDGFMKAPNKVCPLLRRKIKSGGQGCGIHGFAPNACQAYYCDNLPLDEKLLLINNALEEKQVTQKEAQQAVDRALNE